MEAKVDTTSEMLSLMISRNMREKKPKCSGEWRGNMMKNTEKKRAKMRETVIFHFFILVLSKQVGLLLSCLLGILEL